MKHGFGINRTAFFRHFDFLSAAEVIPRQRFGTCLDFFHIAGADDIAAVFSGARTYIHDKVRRIHGIFIMFYHNEGVPDIPQVLQCFQQFVIIPLMETNTGFIQNIHNPYQTGANLCSKTDSLGFAAGKSACCPGQCKIIQTNIHQKTNTRMDFLQNPFRNHFISAAELKVLEKFLNICHRHFCNLRNIFSAYSNGKNLWTQTHPMAGRTFDIRHVFLIFSTHSFGCFAVTPLQVRNDAFKGIIIRACTAIIGVGNPQFFAASAIENNLFDFLRQFPERCIQRKSVFLR